MGTPPTTPKHRLERRRTIPAPRVHEVRRTLARVILGPAITARWSARSVTTTTLPTVGEQPAQLDPPGCSEPRLPLAG